jgi:hypothetical protein
MSLIFPNQFADKIESEETLDEIQPIAIAIPAYHWISTAFFASFINLPKPDNTPCQVIKGVYTPQAMRLAVKKLLTLPDWKRLLVIETDMLLPHDAILKHALHTDPVVGSVYFQHLAPHHCNVMVRTSDGLLHHLKGEGVKHMLDNPALYKAAVVSLGCTSIRRDVFENWPVDLPYFRNEFTNAARDDEFTQGEVSHDVWFCERVTEQGYSIFLDSSILCQHLTEGSIGEKHFLNHHFPPQQESRIVLPNRAERRAKGKARVADYRY